jgi:hypothetical protein
MVIRAQGNDIINIAGQLVKPFQTEKAYHFYDGKTTCWLPKSQCQWDKDDKTMAMPEWLAMEKGLI